jgi:hypothetical protein
MMNRSLNHLVQAFGKTFLNIAGTPDERTLILQMFVYISLFFTLLTIPFIGLLRRELDRRGVKINLGKKVPCRLNVFTRPWKRI